MRIDQYTHYIIRDEKFNPIPYFECTHYKCENLILVHKNPIDQEGLCDKCLKVFCESLHYVEHIKNCRNLNERRFALYESS